MIYDDEVPKFIPGGYGSQYPLRFAPPGLPSMFPILADPMSSCNKLNRPVRSWKRANLSSSIQEVSGWAPAEQSDSMVTSLTGVFEGEEGLLPDSIPDELWQTHFRQHDAELGDRKETEYLLCLYKDCCGRWPVIYDRWQMHAVYGLRGKSIESLKSKFNKVVMKLVEIDALHRKKPSTNVERMQVSQSLRYLPIFSIKYNEKNEYLRRLFLENSLKRVLPDPLQDKALAELMRIPSLTMKKRRTPTISAPGTVVASASVPHIQTEVSSTEANRIKAMLKALGIERELLAKTPKIAKLMATIEKETHTLIMMRDSLQRKKQELEILKTTGASGQRKIPPVHNAHTVLMEAAAAAAAQQKRKR